MADASGPVRPLAEQVAPARAAHPAGALAAVIPPADRGATTQVVFALPGPGLGEKQHTVYVDPYTAQVRGQLTTWYGETPLTTWIDDLHRNLHLGVVGRGADRQDLAGALRQARLRPGHRHRHRHRSVNWTDWPVMSKLSKLGVQAHMGYLFGLANQLLLAALALGLLCVIVWGYRMWWQRRPTRADRRAPLGAAPDRGTWRHMHPAVLAVGLVVTVAVGWALPEFGVSLLGFLIIDVIAGGVRRRRQAVAPVSPAPAGS